MSVLTQQKPLEVLAAEAGLVDTKTLNVYATSSGALPMSFFVRGRGPVYYDRKGGVSILLTSDSSGQPVIYQFDSLRFSELQRTDMPLNLDGEKLSFTGQDAIKPSFTGQEAIDVLRRYAAQMRSEQEDG